MKFIKFEYATNQVPTTMDGEPLHFFTDGEDAIILCAEIDKEDLKLIRDQGRVYVLLHGFKIPPPIGIQANNPFKS